LGVIIDTGADGYDVTGIGTTGDGATIVAGVVAGITVGLTVTLGVTVVLI